MENTPPTGLPTNADSIGRTVDLELSTDALWHLVSDPQRLAGWLGDDVDLALEVGATGTIVDDGVTRSVRIDHVHVGSALEFTWWETSGGAPPSRVRFDVTPIEDGRSRLRITETLCAAARPADAAAPDAGRWETRVGVLWLCSVVAALMAAGHAR